MTTDSSDTGPLVLLDKEAWRQLWRTVKKKAKELDAGITMLGEKIVAKCNQTPAITSALTTLFQRDQIPPAAGKWVGRAGVAVGGYGVYRGYQWLLNSSLNRKVAATESDLLPFLDLLKLQGLRQPDYRDVLHFCIDRRFFVTQFPASPPSKFKRAVPALYDLIQTHGTSNAAKFVDIEEFLASKEVQSLFFESEDDYKPIEYEIYGAVSKHKLDVAIKTVQELWLLVQNPDKIIHIFDSPRFTTDLKSDEVAIIFNAKWRPRPNQEIKIISQLNNNNIYEIQFPVFRKWRKDDIEDKKNEAYYKSIELEIGPKRGISCTTNLNTITDLEGVSFVIVNLPDSLKIQQHGKPDHCLILPRDEMMSIGDFEHYLSQIKWRRFIAG